MNKLPQIVIALASATILIASIQSAFAVTETATPGFNHKIPDEIMTPDKVETRIGDLNFFDGIPTDETITKVYDNLDFYRGVEVFLNFIPATSIEGIRLGMKEMGADDYNEVLIFDDLLDSNPLFLTGNTDTVYALAMLDLEKDGVTVIEIPAAFCPLNILIRASRGAMLKI